jgi:undecaprenyl pyrophosphate phosphatase UppP
MMYGNQTGCPTAILLWGFALAAAVGYVALRWLVSLLERGRFWRFGIYCITVGISSLVYLRFG